MEEIGDGLRSASPEEGFQAVVSGLVRYGPHFLNMLASRPNSDANANWLVEAWWLFGSWMGGMVLTGEKNEAEYRAMAGLELWRAGGKDADDFERLVALCVLALPQNHPLKDEALARSMIEAALGRARSAGDRLEVLNCQRSLFLVVSFDEAVLLVNEGLTILADLTDDPEAASVERDWRCAAALVLSNGSGENAQPAQEHRNFALQVFVPVVSQPQPDASIAIQNVWFWGHLLMNAGQLALAAEVFDALQALAEPDADYWWHARFEGGMVRVDLRQWEAGRESLTTLATSLLTNYAAFVCFSADDLSQLGQPVLNDFGDSSAQREVSEGLSALALSEAACGDWSAAFGHIETTKALDYRQRAALRANREPVSAEIEPSVTAGHSDWKHGVPPADADGPGARLTTILAQELRAPSVAMVAEALAGDEAVLSLGVGATGTFGVCVFPGDTEVPSGTFLDGDMGAVGWMNLLGAGTDTDMGGALLRPTNFQDLDRSLPEVLERIDKVIAAPIRGLLRDRSIQRLTVLPHGWLNLVPLWALPSVSDMAVSVTAGANLFLRTPRIEDISGEALFVLDPSGDLQASHGERAAFLRHGLDRAFPVRTLVELEATEPNIRAASTDACLLHFAGHAIGDAGPFADSGLVVSTGETGASTLWRATELAVGGIDLTGCRLAFLSACESGRGTARIDSIVDYSGIPAALQSLGASAVIATLWEVPDTVAVLFTDLFYERLSQQRIADLPALVHEASRELRRLRADEAAERFGALRDHVTDPRGQRRLENYQRDFGRGGTSTPFAGPAAWASFYHTGSRFLRFGDESVESDV